MNDLIDRQAAIDVIKEFKHGAAEWRDEQEERSDIWHRADSAIASALEIGLRVKKLPSANQWIPCSERLPEEDKDVLITYQYQEGEGDRSHSYCDITTYGDGYFGVRKCSFKEWRAPFEYFHSNYEVVAWMPLPEPYKGEEE